MVINVQIVTSKMYLFISRQLQLLYIDGIGPNASLQFHNIYFDKLLVNQ